MITTSTDSNGRIIVSDDAVTDDTPQEFTVCVKNESDWTEIHNYIINENENEQNEKDAKTIVFNIGSANVETGNSKNKKNLYILLNSITRKKIVSFLYLYCMKSNSFTPEVSVS